MNSRRRKINTAFVFIILLTVLIGIFSIQTVSTVAKDTTRLYLHPFAVSNAAQDINTNLVSMHRYMKDVALSKNSKELETASKLVSEAEESVLNDFKVIREQFLGDKQKVYQLYEAFIQWRDIRNEVIELKRAGEHNLAADITKGKGAEHVALLSNKTEEFVTFAKNKAAEFYKNSQDKADKSIIVLIALVVLTVVLSLSIAITSSRKQIQSDRELEKRNYLIDQNIMMAQLDGDGHILSISNALCRHFDLLQSDVFGQQSHLFLSLDAIEEQEEAIWRCLKSGAQWTGEVKRITRDNTVQWSHLTILPELDDHYDVNGYACIVQDLTSKKESLTDNLTALANRRQFNETLAREFKLAQRHTHSLTLAIIDVDFFKKFNDKYGHPAGDEALAKAGKVIASCMNRVNDYSFRIGGEEFAVLLSDVNREDARGLLEKIRQKIESLEIPHADSDISDYVTISIGACCKDDIQGFSPESFYIEADKALYLAKENRNHLVITSCNPPAK